MLSHGQRRGSCGHVMAVFDGHLKCARCRDKGVGDDPCVQSARRLLQSRLFSLPPPPTEIGRKKTRRFLPPPRPLSWTLHRSVCWDRWTERRLLRSLKPLLARRKELMTRPSQAVRNSNPATKPGPMNSGTWMRSGENTLPDWRPYHFPRRLLSLWGL